MNTILLLLFVMVSQQTIEFPCPQFSVKCYPEKLMPGDTLYILLEAKNPHEQSIYIWGHFSPIYREIQLRLTDNENQTVPLLFETLFNVAPERSRFAAEIKPGETRIVETLAINVPALEDIHDPFWEKHFKTTPPEGKEFLLETILYYRPGASFYRPFETDTTYPMQIVSLEQTIFLIPRPEAEMAMFEEWYNKTPKELFPKPNNWIDTPYPSWTDAKRRVFEYPMNKIPSGGYAPRPPLLICVQNEMYSQWTFIRFGNRYPSHPNLPETWQGWQELEESFTPSTMRDEIHLTRILIQYSATKRSAVLKELKDWFAGMNEVQRVCMVQTIRGRASGSNNTDLFEPFRDLYKMIREYDTAAKSEYEAEWLKKLELLE